MRIEIDDIKNFTGQKIIDIGRILSKDNIPVKNYSINDFDGDLYIKFKNNILVLNVLPTINGDVLNCNVENFIKDEGLFIPCSFRKELINFIDEIITNVNVSKNNDEHQYKISFDFETKNLSFLVINSDEIVVKGGNW